MSERSIFLIALDLSEPADRAAYLDRACPDTGQRRRIENLLAAAEPDAFMARPAAALLSTADGAGTADGDGTADFPPLLSLSTASEPGGPPTAVGGPVPQVPGYEIAGEIARGGMGVVYRARHLRLNRPAAVKMILGGPYQSPTTRLRFLVEAEAVAALDHPHVVGVYEFGQVNGLPFFALEFVGGGTLAQRLAARGRPAPRAAAELMVKLAGAVAAAHAKGIVHRDLKPSNVLLTEAGEPKVADFGLAKVGGSEVTATGVILGTPSYMSPEQAAGRVREVGTHSDVYALGAILYELLTGRPPFQGDSVMETIQQVLSREPDRPRVCAPDVPRDLETICLKCLQKEPGRRYATAAELGADLDAYLRGRPIAARPVGAGERVWKWVRRNPVVAALGAAVGLLLVAGGVGGAVAAARFKDRADREAKAKDQALGARTVAEAARRATAEQLWRSQLSEARANTRSGQPGQRFASLTLLRKSLAAAEEAGEPFDRKPFRDAAAAALAIPDLEVAAEAAGPPSMVVWNVDDRCERFVGSDADGRVTVRRTADGVELFSLPPAGRTQSVYLSGSGRLLVVGAWNLDHAPVPCRVYDLSGAAPEAVHRANMVFSPAGAAVFVDADDGRAVYGTGRAVEVWDRATGRVRSYALPEPQTGRLAMSADGRRAAVPCGRAVRVLELDTGRAVAAAAFPLPPTAAALSPTGRFLAVNQGVELVVRDLTTGRDAARLPLRDSGGIGVEFDPSGDYLLSTGWGRNLRVWDWRAERVLLTVPMVSARFARDGTLLGGGLAPGQALVARFAPGAERFHYGPARRPLYGLSLDPSGQIAVAVAADPAGRWQTLVTDAPRGDALASLENTKPHDLGFAADGAVLTSTADGLFRWPRDATGGAARFGPPEFVRARSASHWCAASADGRVVAVPQVLAEPSGARVVRTDWVGGLPVTLGPQSDVRSVAVSPDGRLVATGSFQPTRFGVSVWDARTGARVAQLPTSGGPAPGPRFSPDGRWLATTDGGNRLWRTDGWTEGPRAAGAGECAGACFSPDSRTVALAGYGAVRLVRLSDGAELVRLPFDERAGVRPLAFSPDGGLLYALGTESFEITGFDLRRLRAGLAELGLDWDAPPLPPWAPAAPARVEFVGTDLLADARKRALHNDVSIYTALQKNLLDAGAYARWGAALKDSGFAALARPLLGAAVTLDSGRGDAWLARAQVHLALGRYAEAVADADAVLRRYPTQLDALECRARALLEVGRPADAAADYTALLDRWPDEPRWLIGRAAAHRAAGDEPRAAADLRRADERAGAAPADVRNNLAWQYLIGPPATRNPKRALELAAPVGAAQPGATPPVNTLGVARYRCGHFADAVSALDKSLAARNRDRAFDLYFLAMCHARLGHGAEAADHFARADRAARESEAALAPTRRGELRAIRAEAAEVCGQK